MAVNLILIAPRRYTKIIAMDSMATAVSTYESFLHLNRASLSQIRDSSSLEKVRSFLDLLDVEVSPSRDIRKFQRGITQLPASFQILQQRLIIQIYETFSQNIIHLVYVACMSPKAVVDGGKYKASPIHLKACEQHVRRI